MFDGEKYLSVFSHEHVAPSLLEYAKIDDNDMRKGFLQYMVKTLYQSAWFGNGGRDESRIPMVLSMVETIWKQYPDLRLGQLLIDVCGPKDLFSMEDEELLAYFQKNKWGE
jgi:hypothetical protein